MTASAPGGTPDEPRALVVIGASAGGVNALSEVVATLPSDLAAAVCVVLHLAPGGASALPDILARAGPLPVESATDGRRLAEGHVYVAPPDFHLRVDGSRLRLDVGPRENRVRPAVDVLFRSAATSWGSRTVAVILSGMLDDGTAGLVEILRHGGVAVVQDPETAAFPGMPASAARVVTPDDVTPIDKVAAVVAQHVRTIVDRPVLLTDPPEPTRRPVSMLCPECGGTLDEVTGAPEPHYACRVGHRYGIDTLLSATGEELERSLWHAVFVLEQRADLLVKMAGRPSTDGSRASRYRRDASAAREHADRLRLLISVVNAEPERSDA